MPGTVAEIARAKAEEILSQQPHHGAFLIRKRELALLETWDRTLGNNGALFQLTGTSLKRSSSSGKAHELVRVGIGGDKLGLLLGVQWWETVWAVGSPLLQLCKVKYNTQCDSDKRQK